MARDLMERYPNVLRWNFKNEGLGIISEACRVHDSDENTFYKHLSGKPRAFKSRSFEEFVARNDFLVNFMINALFNTDERYGFLSEVESRFDNAHEKPAIEEEDVSLALFYEILSRMEAVLSERKEPQYRYENALIPEHVYHHLCKTGEAFDSLSQAYMDACIGQEEQAGKYFAEAQEAYNRLSMEEREHFDIVVKYMTRELIQCSKT